jgi:hypothetical protein
VYTVLIDKKVETFIKKQPANQARRLRDAISSLAANPRPQDARNWKATMMSIACG